MNKTLLLILTGVAAGLLLAPRRGSETWQKIVDGFEGLKDRVSDNAEDLMDEGSDLANEGIKKGKRMARDLKEDAYS